MTAVRARAARLRAREQQRGRRVLAGVAASLALITAITITGQLRGGTQGAVGIAQPSPAAAIDLSGPSVLGEGTVSLADLAGRPVIVYVWGEWCGLRANESGLFEMGRFAAERDDVAVIGVVLETEILRARQLMGETGADFPTMWLDDPAQLVGLLDPDVLQGEVLDADQQAAIALDATGVPVEISIGPLDLTDLDWLAILASRAPDPEPVATVNPSPTEENLLPTQAPTPAPEGMVPGVYVVEEGDTLATIAEAVYGDPTATTLIAEANGLGADQPLQVGTMLQLPSIPDPEPTTPPPSADCVAIEPP